MTPARATPPPTASRGASIAPPDELRRAALHASVEADGLAATIPFLEAVTQQLERLQLQRGAGLVAGMSEAERFARAYMLLTAALAAHGDQWSIDASARALLDQPAMYAAFVQNVDLLYAVRSPAADAVTYLLAAALDR